MLKGLLFLIVLAFVIVAIIVLVVVNFVLSLIRRMRHHVDDMDDIVYDNNMTFVGKYESIAYIEKYSEELLGVKLNRLGLTRSCNKLKQYKGYMFIREIDSVALKNNMV